MRVCAVLELTCVFCTFCRSGGTLTACAASGSQTRLTLPTSRRSRTPWRVSTACPEKLVHQRSRSELSCVCFSSVGKAEVPEGVGAMAARHRGESPLWFRLAEAETRLRGRSCYNTRVSGGVRGLQRQRGQQEDLRGSEETGPAVAGKERLFFVFF